MKKMWARLQRLVKEEKGLTLIELLAVIVILGIIAAIAVPAITGITNNTKQEAHKANAHQIVEAAKQLVAINQGLTFSEKVTMGSVDVTGEKITLQELMDKGYFPSTGIKDPMNTTNSNSYDKAATMVFVSKDGATFTYYITLVGLSLIHI